jgi:predicted solute-binding protein
VYRLGVVSFLNSRPLIAGLDRDPRVELRFDVPARLPRYLDDGRVDAGLIPIVDVLRSGGRYHVLSDACIGCDGETMTVRVFAQVPPDRVQTLWVDGDSHTSVALARVLWREIYHRELELRQVDTPKEDVSELPAVLLIGDKVVDPGRGSFAYEVDLGGAWRQHTGLPFVFAVWATGSDEATKRRSDEGSVAVGASPAVGHGNTAEPPRPPMMRGGKLRAGLGAAERQDLSDILARARDRGVAQATEIAVAHGPRLGWPVELARRYLTRCLQFKLDARSIEGANLFGRLCAQADIVPADATIRWPEDLVSHSATPVGK